MKRKIHNCLRSLVIILLVVCTLQGNLVVPPVQAVTQAEIDALKENASALKGEKAELQKQLNALEGDKAAALEQISLLDDQNEITRQEIANTEAVIADYETLIAQTQAELEAAEKEEEQQFEVFLKCLRAMEEGGTISYWSVLFKATDFADLLGRLDAANEIVEYRQSVIDELKRLQQEITDKKTALEAQLAEQEAAKAELEQRKKELEAQLSKAQELAEALEAGISEYEESLEAMAAEEARIQQQIKDKEAELAASLGPATAGGYIWPVSTSKRITSPYGTRWHPVYQRYKTHNGVDIGGVGYNSSVLATKAGVVIISQKSSSYGNYVVISHGTGNTTLYAHMSSRKVSVGDKVTQGQVIGITGSTGVSTGPHLHYEITENGSRVDPLKYLPGYVQTW